MPPKGVFRLRERRAGGALSPPAADHAGDLDPEADPVTTALPVTLVYANRDERSVISVTNLGLAARHAGCFHLVHRSTIMKGRHGGRRRGADRGGGGEIHVRPGAVHADGPQQPARARCRHRRGADLESFWIWRDRRDWRRLPRLSEAAGEDAAARVVVRHHGADHLRRAGGRDGPRSRAARQGNFNLLLV